MAYSTLQDLFYLEPTEQHLAQDLFHRINIEKIIDALYVRMTQHEITAPFFKNQDVNRLKTAQTLHWKRLFKEGSSEEFLKETTTIGTIHERIGVTPAHYLSAYSFIFAEVLEQTIDSLGIMNKKKRKSAINAFTRLLMMDIAASLDAYIQRSDNSAKSIAQQDLAEKMVDTAANVSTAINRNFIDSLKTNQMSINISQQVSSISAAIEEISVTFETINNGIGNTKTHTNDVLESTNKGRTESADANQAMNSIKDVVTETYVKAEKLSESSQKIEDIVRKIEDIADQTNLLALNATIEAARAGEAGKGFAVVANEVKSLSNETALATKEISDIISELVTQIGDISASMQQATQAVAKGSEITNQVGEQMNEIEQHTSLTNTSILDISNALLEQSKAVKEISQASSQIMENANENREMSVKNIEIGREATQTIASLVQDLSESAESTSIMILSLAKSDHMVWVKKFADMLMSDDGKNSLNSSELKDHTQCRLGKWYYDLGQKTYGQEEVFKNLEKEHIEIHKLGREVYNLHQNRKVNEARSKLSEMEDLSAVIINMLDDLAKLSVNKPKQEDAA